jgi:hypothetical protein
MTHDDRDDAHLRGVLAEFNRRERHHARYNAAWIAAVESGATHEEAHEAARRWCMREDAQQVRTPKRVV